MAQPITMIFTDIHLKESNCQEIKNLLIGQGISLCKKNNLNQCFCLGDVFDSRVSQKQLVLTTLDEIIEAYNKAGITIYCIRGNHDSSDYKSSESFLKPYKHYPNFRLIDDIEIVHVGNVLFGCIAFYDEEVWIKRFEELKECIADELTDEKLVCLSHIAITGSKNQGHVTENSLNLGTFEGFDKIFQGHYHDHQVIGENFVHLGSLTQNNFGEDENKGFWIINDDLSYDLVQSEGKRYKKLEIDLDNITFKQADQVIKSFKKKNPDDFVRVEFTGNQDELKALDKKEYQSLGIDVKVKLKEVETMDVEEFEEIKALTTSDIAEKFIDFCNMNNYSYEEGLSILNQVL